MPRRLAAIVAGDISGYSRLMQIDEEGTHNRVKRIERDLIEPSIVEHHGRLVKTTGDGFIAIFDSPVEAVRCSIVIQQNLVGRNAALPKHHWIEYRIGVNLGDVIIETDDVYGDGVNIATRLEGIAQPGEVYISGGIYEQIKHKLVCGYELLGDRHVKNITDPVRVYRVLSDPTALMQNRKRREGVLIFLLSLALLLIAGGALWYMLLQTGKLPNLASAPVSPPAEVQKAPARKTTSAACPPSLRRRWPQLSSRQRLSLSTFSGTQTGRAATAFRFTCRACCSTNHAGGRVDSRTRDDLASGRQLCHGQQRRRLGKAGPSGNGQAVCDGEISRLRAGMERLRRRKGLRIYRDRKRRCACCKRKLERRKAICRVARGNHPQAVSTAERSRMGICSARRHADQILVGRSVSTRHGQLQELQ